MPLSLRSDEVEEGEEFKVCGTIEKKMLVSKAGGQYPKYVIPVQKKGGEKFNLWLFEQEVVKIKRACGGQIEDYVGCKLILGRDQALNENDEPIMTKSGSPFMQVVIREVRKR